MNDSAKRGQRGIHPQQHRLHRGRVRDIGQFDADIHPAGAQRSDIRRRRGSGRSASVQDNRPGASVGQPMGHRAPDAPEAPRDQVGPVLAQSSFAHRRQCEHDLPDMAGLPHVSQGGGHFHQGPNAVRGHFDNPGVDVGNGGAQHFAQNMGAFLGQPMDVQHGVRDIRAHTRHLGMGPRVALADLDKAAAAGETGQRCLNETWTGQAVDNEVHPGATGIGEYLLTKMGLTAVIDMLHPHCAHVGLLGRAAGGEHLRTGGKCQLYGSRADTSRRRVNQDPAAGTRVRVPECQPGRGMDNRNPRHPDRRQPFRQRGEQCGGGHNRGTKRRGREPNHPRARR